MKSEKLQLENKNWRKERLGNWLELKYGFGLPEQKRVKGKVPVYGSSGIVGWHNKPAVKKKGIVIGRKGNVGAVYFSEKPFYPIDTVYFIDSLKKKGDLKFFYYFLKTIDFKKVDINVGVPGLNRDTAYSLEVFIPEDTDEQRRIVEILSAFDEKIEVNNKINKTLEEMAQTIFKEWFVKFRFPGWKKVKFVDSELGKIPEGWKVKNIMKIIKRLPVGKKYDNRTALPEGKVPILDQGQSGIIGFHNEEPSVKAGSKNPIAVFSNHTCYYRLITFNFSCIQNVIPYVGTNGYPTTFVYYLTKDRVKMSGYKGHWPEFAAQKFAIPPSELAVKFSEIIQPVIEKVDKTWKENQTLAALRDLLLSKLMRGEITI